MFAPVRLYAAFWIIPIDYIMLYVTWLCLFNCFDP